MGKDQRVSEGVHVSRAFKWGVGRNDHSALYQGEVCVSLHTIESLSSTTLL
jgi:hypothetical protein